MQHFGDSKAGSYHFVVKNIDNIEIGSHDFCSADLLFLKMILSMLGPSIL